jgi:hypothetical protein
MVELSMDNEAREKRRQDCLDWAKSHCDNDIVYRKMHGDVIKTGKIGVTTKKETEKTKTLSTKDHIKIKQLF